MRIAQLTAYPDDTPVSLEDAKEYLRQESSAQETIIRHCLAAATTFYAKRTNRALAPATFAGYVREWPCEPLRIPIEPVDLVTSVEYRDVDGVDQVVAGGDLDVAYEGGRATLFFKSTFARPSLYLFTANPITVFFNAGYDPEDGTGSGDTPEFTLDPRARMTILMLTQHWWENRGIVRVGENVSKIEMTAAALMEQSEVFAF